MFKVFSYGVDLYIPDQNYMVGMDPTVLMTKQMLISYNPSWYPRH
jgi:hypothetical protein